MKLKLEDNHRCYVCGKDNPDGFRLDFEHKPGRLTASVIFEEKHQGYKGIVHGGIVSMILDEMMVNLAWKEGLPAVTAELTVRLKKPTRVGEKVHFESRLDKKSAKALTASAVALDEKGNVLAEAHATCVRIAVSNKS